MVSCPGRITHATADSRRSPEIGDRQRVRSHQCRRGDRGVRVVEGAFFHHFASKQALAEALVDQYVVGDLQLLADGYAAAESAGDDPVDRLEAFLRYFEGMADEIMAGTTGCLYTSVLAEQHLIDAGTSVPITAATEQWREIRGSFRAALDGRRDADIDALADHLWVTFWGHLPPGADHR